MELREMIETAAKLEGSQNNLAKVIGVAPDYLTHAKAGRRGLPIEACGKLAEILGIDRWAVTAASALVTQKNPEKRAYLTPFVQELPRKAAQWMLGIATAAMMTTAPSDAQANDTFNVSSPALQAAPSLKQQRMELALCQVKAWITETVEAVRGMFSGGLRRFGFAGS